MRFLFIFLFAIAAQGQPPARTNPLAAQGQPPAQNTPPASKSQPARASQGSSVTRPRASSTSSRVSSPRPQATVIATPPQQTSVGVFANFTPSAAEYLALVPKLKASFIACQFQANSTAHPAARAIRAAFHDAGTHSISSNTGGADGSLQFELQSQTNNAIIPLISFYNSIKTSGTSLADIIVLGAYVALGTITSSSSLYQGECNGPHIQMQIGRKDINRGFSTSVLPTTGEPFTSITSKFLAMGLTEREMTILSVGGHSVGAVRTNVDTVAGVAFATFDSTPTIFDKVVFSEMLGGKRVLKSDASFAANAVSVLQEFATGSNAFFLSSFASAFVKMATLGVNNSTLTPLVWN